MVNAIKFWFILGVSLLLAACGSGGKTIVGKGKIATDKRTVQQFSSIQISGNFNVIAKVNKEQAVSVSANENLLPYIETTVENKSLVIKPKQGYELRWTKQPIVTVMVPNLNSVHVSGTGQFSVDGIKRETFTATLSGSGDGRLRGQVQNLQLKISGSGQFFSKDMTAKNIEVSISGSGNAIVSAADSLDARISGSGTIEYFGTPDKVNTSISGSGTVTNAKHSLKPKTLKTASGDTNNGSELN